MFAAKHAAHLFAGVTVAVLNPKTALFSGLPAAVDRARAVPLQLLSLGLFVLMASSAMACTAGQFGWQWPGPSKKSGRLSAMWSG
jgi:threonine/homoserine/homoserine lactone efflux protein